MASWMNQTMNNLRVFGGAKRANNTTNPNQPPNRQNSGSPLGYSPTSLFPPSLPPQPASPSLSAATTASAEAHQSNLAQNKIPLFFRPEHAGFIVKGNFMTLAAKPHLVEEGEWLAHQIVEQNRLLSGMLRCVQEKDRSTARPTCNEHGCPTMSAGPTTYTWIDTKGNPINLPAPTYIKHIQTWVNGKIQDQSIFPTDNFLTAPPLPRTNELKDDPNHWLGKTSGFPQRFESEIKNMFKQMLRCYAHLYWQHWLTFWELSAHRELNTCFVHFMNVGRSYALLNEKDIEPMAPLVELWVKEGVLPKFEPVVTAPVAAAPAPSAAGGVNVAPGTGAATGAGWGISGSGVGNAGTAAAMSD